MQTMTEVRERPILFSGEMVRAILDGTKTQTRRVVIRRMKDEGEWVKVRPVRGYTPETIRSEYPCPYGQPGDLLWVRESWRALNRFNSWPVERGSWVVYEADGPHDGDARPARSGGRMGKLRPSIHMPRWASRITLEITDVRVERVQEITEADARADGVERSDWEFSCEPYRNYADPRRMPGRSFATALRSFETLWDSLNGRRGYGWDANPWVWVVSFNRINP
jgi:hypothetical protein